MRMFSASPWPWLSWHPVICLLSLCPHASITGLSSFSHLLPLCSRRPAYCPLGSLRSVIEHSGVPGAVPFCGV